METQLLNISNHSFLIGRYVELHIFKAHPLVVHDKRHELVGCSIGHIRHFDIVNLVVKSCTIITFGAEAAIPRSLTIMTSAQSRRRSRSPSSMGRIAGFGD